MLLPLILETDDLVKKVVLLIENEKAERVGKRQTQKRDEMERFQRAVETIHWQRMNHFERDMEEPDRMAARYGRSVC